jgi:hypothetical protein
VRSKSPLLLPGGVLKMICPQWGCESILGHEE